MYLAAMHTVCREMLALIGTLHLIEQVQTRGWPDLPDDHFTGDVMVTAASGVPPGEIKLYLAPVDTPMPESLDIDLEAPGWKNAVNDSFRCVRNSKARRRSQNPLPRKALLRHNWARHAAPCRPATMSCTAV